MGGACRGKAEDEGVEMKVKVDCSRERGRNHLDLVIAVKWTTCADLSLLIPCPFYPPRELSLLLPSFSLSTHSCDTSHFSRSYPRSLSPPLLILLRFTSES